LITTSEDELAHKILLMPGIELGKVKVKVKLSLFLTKHHAMKTYWGVGV
jgi:hypothetical protein